MCDPDADSSGGTFTRGGEPGFESEPSDFPCPTPFEDFFRLGSGDSLSLEPYLRELSASGGWEGEKEEEEVSPEATRLRGLEGG